MYVDNDNPLTFIREPSQGGVVENITYKNFTLNNTRKAVEFNMAWHMVGTIKPPATILPVVQIIHVSGITYTVGDIQGLAGSPIQGVTFKKCSITAQRGLLIEHARNVDLSGLKLDVKEGEAVTKREVE